MFQRWGFLLGEMWVLLLLAALLGLFAGWLIWGRRTVVAADTSEADRLRAALEACATKGREQAGRIAALEGDLSAANAKAHDAHIAAENARPDAKARADARGEAVQAAVIPAAVAPASFMASPLMSAPAPQAKAEEPAAPKSPAKPQGLDKARGGKPDDLKLVKGIGPKLEALCNRLGFYHFDQIANWTASEIAWVDENLEGFKGRVTRDEWVAQARDLMNGLPPRPGGER